MRFEVKRSEWYRGASGDNSALFVKRKDRTPGQIDRKRCCLGFFANACDLSDRQIINCRDPSDVAEVSNKGATIDWSNLPTRGMRDIMATNDDDYLSDKQREKRLINLFKEIGHEIVFVD